MKRIIALISILATLISLFVYFSGKDHFSDLFNQFSRPDPVNTAREETPKPGDPKLEKRSEEIWIKRGNKALKIHESYDAHAALSPKKNKVAIIDDSADDIIIANINNYRRHVFSIGSEDNCKLSNLIWINNNTIRVHIGFGDSETTIEGFIIPNSGTYELTFDKFNSLIDVNPYPRKKVSQNSVTLRKTIFQDNFSDSSTGWGSSNDRNSEAGYKNEEYEIKVTIPNLISFQAAPAEIPDDYTLQINCRIIEGYGDYGILFNYADINNFYEYNICPARGTYSITQKNNGFWYPIFTNIPSSSIRNGTNRLFLNKKSGIFTFGINESKLRAININNTELKGPLHLGAISNEYGYVSVHFDDFLLTTP